MAIIVLFICIFVSTLYKLSVRLNLESAARSQRKKETDMMEWARTHEEDWVFGTDHVYKRDGKLYYFGYGIDNLGYCDHILYVDREVKYGWDRQGIHCGLVLNGQVVFGYTQFMDAQRTNGRRLQLEKHLYQEYPNSPDGGRMHFINEKRALTLGYFRLGSWPMERIYYVPEECKYYAKNAYGYKQVVNKSHGPNQYFQWK